MKFSKATLAPTAKNIIINAAIKCAIGADVLMYFFKKSIKQSTYDKQTTFVQPRALDLEKSRDRIWPS